MKEIPTRNAYGDTIVEEGKNNKNLVLIDADIAKSTRSYKFHTKYPERAFNMGIAEQNMVNVAAGMASSGLNVFTNTYAVFASMRAAEQVRTFVCYPNLNVTVVASHGGLQVSYDGVTHQATEDIAIMNSFPNMTIVQPTDPVITKKATKALVEHQGPAYLRLTRNSVPNLYDEDVKFELGKGIITKDTENPDCVIFSTGVMVSKSLEAAEELEKNGYSIRVVDIHTIKPLDKELVSESAEEAGAVVVAEDHSIVGGLGSVISQYLSTKIKVPMEFIGLEDVFAESGEPEELFSKYGMNVENIVEKVEKAVSRK